MSDSIKKYNELLSEGKIVPSQKTGGFHNLTKGEPSGLTEEQKAQAYRLLTEYDAEVIKFAFNRIMFG